MVPETLKNEYFLAKDRMEKMTLLLNFLLGSKSLKIIVFLNTCASVDFYFKILSNYSIFKG
jgi:superfamily II DNA/RNA helicase